MKKVSKTLQSTHRQVRSQPWRASSDCSWNLARCFALILALAGSALAQEVDSPFQMEMIAGADGTELAVYEAGNPEGAEIVFIHGLMGSHLAWANQLAGPLAENYRLIAVEIRGHANSDKPLDPEAYTSSKIWARDIHAVLEAKSLDNPVLIGWSYGPRVIKDYIRYFGQNRIAGVVFVSSAPVIAGTEEEFALYGAGMLALFDDLLSADEETRRQATSDFIANLLTAEPLDQGTFDLVLDIAMLVPPEARVGMFSRLLDNTDIVSDLAMPALLVHGLSDQVVDPKASSNLAELIDQVTLITYPDIGHAPFLENSARFDADIHVFMRSLREPLAGLSGGWYDPATIGQGWNFLAAENGLYAHYFGYGEDGEQIWLITEEVIENIEAGVAINYSLLKGSGGSFGAPVPPDNLEHFGDAKLTFHSCEEATAEITSEIGNETQYLQRFASIRNEESCGLRNAKP
jgi:non-heme chloroperoxidase